jgi:hypothetical protein
MNEIHFKMYGATVYEISRLGSLIVVFYFLLRASPEEAHEEQESEE